MTLELSRTGARWQRVPPAWIVSMSSMNGQLTLTVAKEHAAHKVNAMTTAPLWRWRVNGRVFVTADVCVMVTTVRVVAREETA